MKTIDIVKNHIPQILSAYGLPPITGNKHYKGECPICSKRGKFRIDNKENTGSYICVCSSGDIWKLLIEVTGKDFRTLARELDILLGNVYAKEPIAPRRDYQLELLAFWRTMTQVKGTSVNRYLSSRGIWNLPARAMKILGDDSESIMFCVATNDAGNPVITHQTYLQGDKKADVDVPKRTQKVDRDRESVIDESIAIRLFEPQTCLGIAEGIETALSAHQLYECAAWSVMNSSFMKKFRAPTGVEHLIVFADSDNNGTGMAAAFVCGNANILANNDVKKVTIRYPQEGDFNDVLLCAQEVNEFILTK